VKLCQSLEPFSKTASSFSPCFNVRCEFYSPLYVVGHMPRLQRLCLVFQQAAEKVLQVWQYVVLEVVNTQDEKLVRAVNAANRMEVTVHLRDAWADTILQEGDVVNLVADLDEHNGGLHAICDCSKGGHQCSNPV